MPTYKGNVKTTRGRIKKSPGSVLKGTGKTPAQHRYQIKRTTRDRFRSDEMKRSGVRSFPGQIKNSKNYSDKTVGRFTQSIKGMKPRNYIQKAMDNTVAMFKGGDSGR